MWTICRSALPIAAMLVMPLAASAQGENGSQEVTVTANPDKAALTRWTNRVGHSITDNLVYPAPLGTANPPEGVVDVTFRCSDAGMPSQIAVTRSSGSQFLDRAALRAVQRVKTLHPLPQGVGHDQLYKARLMFLVGDGMDTQRRIAEMQRDARGANEQLWERRWQKSAAADAISIPAAALR